MRTLLNITVFCLCFASLATKAKEYVVGVEDVSYYPLFDFRNSKTSYTKELLDEFGRQYGHKFIYLPLPIKRFSRWLIEEQIDFKYPDNVRWEDGSVDNSSFIYSEATITLVAGTLTLKDGKISPNNVRVVGTLLGFYPTHWVDLIKQNKVTLYEDPSTMVLIRQMLRGHVDAIDLEPSVVNHHLSLLGKPGLITLNRDFDYEVYSYYLSTIKHADVIKQFNEFLRDNQEYLKKLRSKFNIVDYTPYLDGKAN